MLRLICVFCLFSLIVGYPSCTDDRSKGSFSDEELSWLVYKYGDTIRFKSEHQVQSWIVEFRTEKEQVKEYYPLEAEVILRCIQEENSITDQRLRIYLLKDRMSFKRYIRIGEVYRSLDIMKPQAEWMLGDKTFTQVYEVKEDSLRSNSRISNLLYNKEQGFIYYIDREGNVFQKYDLETAD